MSGHGGGHASGTGRRGATEFPATWTHQEITDRIADVARYPDEPPRRLAGGVWHTTGVRDEVRIVALLDPDGSVRTAFPVDGPGVHRNADRAPDPTRPTLDDLAAGRVGHAAGELLARLEGRLPDDERGLLEQLRLAGEWDELGAALEAGDLTLTAEEQELLDDLR